MADNDGKKVSVISIVGKSGFGKTTLAYLVSNDEKVNKEFQIKAWIGIGDYNIDAVTVMKLIIERLTSDKSLYSTSQASLVHDDDLCKQNPITTFCKSPSRPFYLNLLVLFWFDKMWLAQGFINDVQQGYQCVKYLIQRRFLLVSGEDDDDEMKKKVVVTKCKLHKLMHNLALSVAGDHCRYFSKPPPPQSADGRSSSSKIFHARFDFDLSSTKELEMFGANKMRTIISSDQARRRYSEIHVSTILEKISNTFRYLQALDMHALRLQIVPCCIGKLKLSKLSKKFHIRKWRLNLEDKDHLDNYLNEVPKEIQSLTIEWKIYNCKCTTQELTLCTSVTDMSITGFQGELIRCPQLCKLVKLSLNRCANLTNLDKLDQISNLEVLVLDDLPNLEDISSSSSLPKLLSSLEELWLTELPKLKTWWKNEVNDNASSSSFKSLS
ncbi:hypothetical protein G4B88_009805 [Cannabis sativa]|uniref:NB-ARC domain-containing protein n=1 Tax=Cannabis sativa TaxID=3483 RepID=A0A7J6E319_CANSA|nr:hypothetical protein G4B88_009805 [Cannabis sativa]